MDRIEAYWGLYFMAKIVSLINQKGGVGKTASTNAISVCLKHKGYKVLCVDFDPQGNLTFSMGVDAREHPTIYDVLKHTVKARYAIQRGPIVDTIPTDSLLRGMEREFTGRGNESLLRNALKSVSPLYDYILIDSPPDLSLLSANVIVASNIILIPGLPDGYTLQGIIQIHETICRIKQRFNPNLVFGGILLCNVFTRENLSKETYATAKLLSERLGIPLLDTCIRHSNVLSKALTLYQRDMIEFAPKNNAVKDYMALVDELLEKGVL